MRNLVACDKRGAYDCVHLAGWGVAAKKEPQCLCSEVLKR